MGGSIDDFLQIILWAKIAFALSFITIIVWCIVQHFIKNEELREVNKKVLSASITLIVIGILLSLIVWTSTGDILAHLEK